MFNMCARVSVRERRVGIQSGVLFSLSWRRSKGDGDKRANARLHLVGSSNAQNNFRLCSGAVRDAKGETEKETEQRHSEAIAVT